MGAETAREWIDNAEKHRMTEERLKTLSTLVGNVYAIGFGDGAGWNAEGRDSTKDWMTMRQMAAVQMFLDDWLLMEKGEEVVPRPLTLPNSSNIQRTTGHHHRANTPTTWGTVR